MGRLAAAGLSPTLYAHLARVMTAPGTLKPQPGPLGQRMAASPVQSVASSSHGRSAGAVPVGAAPVKRNVVACVPGLARQVKLARQGRLFPGRKRAKRRQAPGSSTAKTEDKTASTVLLGGMKEAQRMTFQQYVDKRLAVTDAGAALAALGSLCQDSSSDTSDASGPEVDAVVGASACTTPPTSANRSPVHPSIADTIGSVSPSHDIVGPSDVALPDQCSWPLFGEERSGTKRPRLTTENLDADDEKDEKEDEDAEAEPETQDNAKRSRRDANDHARADNFHETKCV